MSSKNIPVMAVIFALVVLSPLAIDVYLPALPEMTRFFSAQAAQMQMTISLFMISMGLGQLVAGPLSDRFGRRASAMAGLSLYMVGSLVAISAESLTVLYLARVLQGMGSASCSVTAFAWVRDHFDARESGKWISYMGGMIGTIPTLAPLLGSFLSIAFGWQANFVFMAALGGLILLCAAMLMEKGAPKRDLGQQHEHQAKSHLLQDLSSILGNRQFLIYALTGMLTMGGILSYAISAPYVAMDMAGLGELGFALAFGAIGLLQLLGSVFAPRVVSHIGRRKTIMAGAALSVAGSCALLMVPITAPLWYFAAAGIGAIGFNLIFGTASGLTLEPFKHCAGLAAAIDGCMRIAGGGLVVMLIRLPELGIFATAALGYALLGISLLLVFWEHRTRSTECGEAKLA
ncbi:multidrug effflux MFS transporter [Parendozoicomonas haliclonae]|uniref:Bcr/CflA family efflux transporter n=1 Tax=Parendozoicomonas haliclonae TaxID=1960125 RepID=A0A1X7ARA2_9GAMM|nr:multidrug effflux MFS transporter [Parendozoicomonas haliclonae]SMA50610.1 Multidrug resistance protein MdtL [Parendozoicomonas haliclonae]